MDDARARDVVLRGMLSVIREGQSADWCRRQMITALRKMLAPPHDVSHIGPEVERARAEAEESVKKFCRMCSRPDCRGPRKDTAA
jgi:hypothetical protein